MLFNSYEYLFLFLPITVVLFYFLQKRNQAFSVVFLVLMSWFFYAWWDFKYIALLLASILFNFTVGEILIKREKGGYRKPLFVFGIIFNIGLIGYFKYCDFFISNVNAAFDQDYHLQYVILPLAISFFTFQQIAYLVDSYRHEVKERSFWRYCLFVSFFPQLIAGPIVHHKEMMPQFKENKFLGIPYDHLMVGLMILAMGLFKKAVIADGVAPFSTEVFSKADAGQAVSFLRGVARDTRLYFPALF
jgi:alginate O-acetyltransferase complex protein AlgI